MRSGVEMPRSKTTRAISLYQKGHNFREIGERLGVSASTARRWIRNEPIDPRGSAKIKAISEDFSAGLRTGSYGLHVADMQTAPTVSCSSNHPKDWPCSICAPVTSVSGRPKALRSGFFRGVLCWLGIIE